MLSEKQRVVLTVKSVGDAIIWDQPRVELQYFRSDEIPIRLLRRCIYYIVCKLKDRLCGLRVRDPGYRSRGPGAIPGDTRLSEK
jgi:hypothetical protein